MDKKEAARRAEQLRAIEAQQRKAHLERLRRELELAIEEARKGYDKK